MKTATCKAQFTSPDFCYHNWFESEIERANDNNEEIDIDTVKAREIFAKVVIDFINDELKTKLEYVSLDRPCEYNFRDDEIEFNYSSNDVKLIKQAIADNGMQKALINAIDDATTSRSGYHAFYTRAELIKNDDHVMRLMLETLFNYQYQGNIRGDLESYYDSHFVYDTLSNDCVTYKESN